MPYGLVDCAGDSCWGSVSPVSCIKSVLVFSVVVVISSARRSSKRCLSNHDRDVLPPCFLWILQSLEPVWNQLRYQSGYHPVGKGWPWILPHPRSVVFDPKPNSSNAGVPKERAEGLSTTTAAARLAEAARSAVETISEATSCFAYETPRRSSSSLEPTATRVSASVAALLLFVSLYVTCSNTHTHTQNVHTPTFSSATGSCFG